MARKKNLSLPKEASNQLHRNIEAHPSWSCKDLVEHRPALYGGNYKKATQNRHNYLTTQKKKDPTKYYRSFAAIGAAATAPSSAKKKKKVGDDCDSSDSEILGSVLNYEDSDGTSSSEERILAPVDQSFRRRSARVKAGSVKTGSGTPLKSPPPKTVTIEVPSTPKSTTSFPAGLLSPLSARSNMSTVAGHDGPLQTGRIKFKNLVQASEYADETVMTQFDLPEDYPGGLFVQKIDDITISAHELGTKLKVMLPFFVDLRDFEYLSCFIVLGGTALMITLNTLPTYLLKEHASVLGTEKARCKRTEDKTAETITAILADDSRYLKKILLMMPEGFGLSADFSENIPRHDVKVHAKIREKTSSFVAGSGRRAVQQVYFNLYWQLRIVKENRQLMASFQDDDVGLDSAFEGMSTS
eukprot:Sro84_g044960.1 n/a (413) ;mRNA; f:85448-86686